MNKCVCCYSDATQVRGRFYHCDCCASEYDEYWDYKEEGYRSIDASRLSGYMGVDPTYMDLRECNYGC